MDSKYGRLFTEGDVTKIVKAIWEEVGSDPSTGIFDVTQNVIDGHVNMLSDAHELTFREGEPLFVLRGKDKAAVPTIADYNANARSIGASGEHINAVEEAYEDFLDYAEDNPDIMKVPD